MAGALCSKCGMVLDKVLIEMGLELHPMCDKKALFGEPDGEDPIKSELIDMILWADGNSARSLQVAIGPSELGNPCDRAVGYRMAGVAEPNNRTDPWPAIVGTAIHQWTEKAVNAYEDAHPDPRGRRWLTEQKVRPDPLVTGHSDYFHQPRNMVVDLKTAGRDVMRRIHKEGPPIGNQVQVQLYGLGYEKLGFTVKEVALAFVPRAGWLSDMYVWTQPYDRSAAEGALARMYGIGHRLIELDVMNQPHRWEMVESTPSKSCGYCPFMNVRDADRGADGTGCGGR